MSSAPGCSSSSFRGHHRICLALYYVPSAETAHTSVAYITKQVAAGAFLRSLHYYGSSAMIVVLLLHFLQTFLYGSYKGRRELLWISGALLSLLVLAMGFTGYLLPWDQKAYFATAVGTNIAGEIPLIGGWLTQFLRGGDTLGTLTLSRFYVAHLFLIPAAIFLFIAVHIALFRKAGPAGPIQEDPVQPKLAPEGFYPRQVLMDMGFALLLIIGLGILAYFHPVALGPVANPADTQFLPRPEWYYLPMFEWLKFWQGPAVVFAIVVIPGILALLFFLLPFLDRGLERRPWRRPIPLLGVAIVLVGAAFLGVKSHLDYSRDPTTAAQIARQDQQEEAYSKAPFEPYAESSGAVAPGQATSVPVNPLVAQGRGIFEANGCSGCHGEHRPSGTPVAPSLVGVTSRYPSDELASILRSPTAKMRAGRMPSVDLSALTCPLFSTTLARSARQPPTFLPAITSCRLRGLWLPQGNSARDWSPIGHWCSGGSRSNRRSWSANVPIPCLFCVPRCSRRRYRARTCSCRSRSEALRCTTHRVASEPRPKDAGRRHVSACCHARAGHIARLLSPRSSPGAAVDKEKPRPANSSRREKLKAL